MVCRDERGHRTAVVQVLRLDGLGLGRRAGLERVEHLDVDGGYARCVLRPGVGAQRGLHRDLRRLVREQRDRPEPGCVGRPLILSSTDRSSRKPTGPSSRLSLPMGTILGECRYALRQFWSRARLHGLGRPDALARHRRHDRDLHADPRGHAALAAGRRPVERLYRVGDGDNCCVQGGPQDRWGMFSYPLFERLKAEAPEFEQLTAFQAGGCRVSVRRQPAWTSPRARSGRNTSPATTSRPSASAPSAAASSPPTMTRRRRRPSS